jgi:splicing factor 3B subunit 1
MSDNGAVKKKLVSSFSVPKNVAEEFQEEAEHSIDEIPQNSALNKNIIDNNTNNNKHKQRKFDVIREKLERLESKQNGGSTSKAGVEVSRYHRRDRLEKPNEEFINEDLEKEKRGRDEKTTPTGHDSNKDRDKTPTREERDQLREQKLLEEKGDKTPTKEERDRVRRGKKRKLDDDNANNKDLISSEDKRPQLPVIMGITLNRENLDKLLPQGFKIIDPPDDYRPLNNIPPDITAFDNFKNNQVSLLVNNDNALVNPSKFDPRIVQSIPDLKELQHFGELDMRVFQKLITLKNTNLSTLSEKEQSEIKCMKLILRIKNGSSNTRKPALRSLVDNANVFGPDIIFNIILPLLSDPNLDEQGRHLLIKIIGRVMFKIGESIRPFTEKILIVIMPLLIDDDKIARLEGRDVISKLSKVVGLLPMINILRPDLSNEDEYVRTLISKTFAVIANSLGIQSLIPFLKAISRTKKNWIIRNTGIRIIQQIAILMGSTILPYLNQLIHCIYKKLNDEVVNVRMAAASTISSLAEAASPYGYESFEIVIKPLWKGLKTHRGKALAQFVRALGNLIPLMNPEVANFYSYDLLKIINKESATADDDMKRAILITVEKICKLDIIDKKLIFKSNIIESFFKNFWSRRIALDRKFTSLCINACYALSLKIGTSEVILQILPSLKDESEPYRRMSLEASDKVLTSLGCFDLDDKTVTRLLNGLLFCFQHQTLENKQTNSIVLNGFANILNNLGIRSKEHIMPIISAVLYRLKNKDSEVREQAADLIAKLANVLKICDEESLLIRLCTILYESLGEVYPDVLGSILNALRKVISAIKSIDSLNPPVSQILSTLTPILKNRHEKVQEMTLPLIGDIAIRAPDFISHKEWIRISFELLEMLKAYKKNIRKNANKTFGLIAKVIGPSDVLVTLLDNLKVQERQLRVCTAVAIGIVAEVCLPYSVLPLLMNEYRYPDKNVQNGVLKALGFMFEYIGDIGSDYIYATTPLLLDALTDRDLVHRQIASSVVKNIALGSFGQGYEDAFINFLDLIWPNIFETSPHVISQVLESIESLNIVLGNGILLGYLWCGLFHPARKVRESYWRIYNIIYVNSVHSMVPFYPRFEALGPAPGIEATEMVDLGVPELDLWI